MLTYAEAASSLNERRDQLNYKSPCQKAPSLWDGREDIGEGNELVLQPFDEIVFRVADATRQCWTCKVLAECRSLRATGQLTNTVLAGEWVE
jgi:hypothetical protein